MNTESNTLSPLAAEFIPKEAPKEPLSNLLSQAITSAPSDMLESEMLPLEFYLPLNLLEDDVNTIKKKKNVRFDLEATLYKLESNLHKMDRFVDEVDYPRFRMKMKAICTRFIPDMASLTDLELSNPIAFEDITQDRIQEKQRHVISPYPSTMFRTPAASCDDVELSINYFTCNV